MRISSSKLGALLSLALLISLLLPGRVWSQPNLRDWTVEDSVAVRYFSYDQKYPTSFPLEGQSVPGGFVVTSPDKKYFFFASWHGVLANDSNIYELSVFETDAVAKAVAAVKSGNRPNVQPVTTVRRADFTSDMGVVDNKAGILDAEWTPGSDGIFFRGVDEKGMMQAFRLDVSSGKVTQLTSSPGNVERFAYRDGGIVYTVKTTGLPEQELTYPAMAIKRGSDGSPLLARTDSGSTFTVLVAYREGVPKPIKGSVGGVLSGHRVAPGGRLATLERRRYRQDENGRQTVIAEMVVADLSDGEAKELPFVLGSPITVKRPGDFSPRSVETVFGVDGDRLILVNVNPAGAKEPVPGRIFEFNAKTGKSKELTSTNPASGADPRPIQDVQWIENEKKILLDTGAAKGPIARRELKLEGGTWKWSVGKSESVAQVRTRRSGSSFLVREGEESQFPAHLGLEVAVRQDANTPPAVVASSGDARLELTGPDSALAGLWRAEAKTVTWTEPGGKEGRGLLMLPRKNVSNKPPPMVIQVYASQPNMFLPDGFTQGVYAAQPLVAQGIAVLQVGNNALNPRGFVPSLDAAIETLGKQGLIDPSRVGATGYSINHGMVLYAVANPGKYPLNAVAVADGYDATFPGLLNDAAGGGGVKVGSPHGPYEVRYGGFFWENKSKWLETELVFNMDRVRTPVLVFNHLRGKVKSQNDNKYHIYEAMIGAFSLMKKPVDLISLRDGMHSLKRPKERIAEMQGVVDWMAFWLQGRSPADPERAKTWAILRKQQDAVLANLNKATGNSQK